MGVTMRLLKIIAVVGVVGVVIGFVHFTFFRPAGEPQRPADEFQLKVIRPADEFQLKVVRPADEFQLKVVTELAKTQYQVGEEISVKPYLINVGKQPITFSHGYPLLFVKVYDEENREILHLPEWCLAIGIGHTLSPSVPYKGYEGLYTFTLEQPGRYKVVAWAKLSLYKPYADLLHIYADLLHIYSDPIWIEVTTGSN